MQQLKYRFVFEAVRWWLFAFIAFLIATAVNEIPCMVTRIAKVQCDAAFPFLDMLWPVIGLAGIAAAAWRYYRDYHCGDMYRDFYD